MALEERVERYGTSDGRVVWLFRPDGGGAADGNPTAQNAFPDLCGQSEIERVPLSDARIDDLRHLWVEARADRALRVRAPVVEAVACLALIAVLVFVL